MLYSAISVGHWRQNANWSEPRGEGHEEVEKAGLDNSLKFAVNKKNEFVAKLVDISCPSMHRW